MWPFKRKNRKEKRNFPEKCPYCGYSLNNNDNSIENSNNDTPLNNKHKQENQINKEIETSSKENFLKHPKMQARINREKVWKERQKAETEKRAQEIVLKIQSHLEEKIQTGDFPNSYVWLENLHEENRQAIRIAEKVLKAKYLEKGWDEFCFRYNVHNDRYFDVRLKW